MAPAPKDVVEAHPQGWRLAPSARGRRGVRSVHTTPGAAPPRPCPTRVSAARGRRQGSSPSARRVRSSPGAKPEADGPRWAPSLPASGAPEVPSDEGARPRGAAGTARSAARGRRGAQRAAPGRRPRGGWSAGGTRGGGAEASAASSSRTSSASASASASSSSAFSALSSRSHRLRRTEEPGVRGAGSGLRDGELAPRRRQWPRRNRPPPPGPSRRGRRARPASPGARPAGSGGGGGGAGQVDAAGRWRPRARAASGGGAGGSCTGSPWCSSASCSAGPTTPTPSSCA